MRQHRHQVPQGRRGDHGVHVRGRQRAGRGRRTLRMVRGHAGLQELRVPVVGRVHHRRVPVRVSGVQDSVRGVQETRWPVRSRSNAPVFLAGTAAAAVRERLAAAQVRETSSHHRAVASPTCAWTSRNATLWTPIVTARFTVYGGRLVLTRLLRPECVDRFCRVSV